MKLSVPHFIVPQAYFIRKAYFTLRSNISLVPQGTNFIEKSTLSRAFFCQRVTKGHRIEIRVSKSSVITQFNKLELIVIIDLEIHQLHFES